MYMYIYVYMYMHTHNIPNLIMKTNHQYYQLVSSLTMSITSLGISFPPLWHGVNTTQQGHIPDAGS